jgi:hypothetical protein
MLEDPIAIILLLVVGIVALVMALLLLREYLTNKNVAHVLWAVSFLVLFVSGVLIILNGFEVLQEPLVPVVAALIPAGLASGLFFAVGPEEKFGLLFTAYALIGIVLLAIAKLEILFEDFSSMILMAVHIPSGLTIVLLPLLTALRKETEMTSIFFALGGFCISLGGVLLAIATVDETILLSFDDIFAILPILLVIVGVLFVLGIILPTKWKIQVPFLT